MNNWKNLEPTPAQSIAINDYNKVYGVNICVENKQDAHNVISVYAPKQYLEFENGKVKGTDVYFIIVDIKKFKDDKYNKYVKKNVKKVVVNDDGTVTLSILQHNNTNNNLLELGSLMDKMLNEPSFSEYEDSLGYLSPDELELEKEMYGCNPMWWE